MRKRPPSAGFTLVELLVVIVIIASLAGLSLAVLKSMKQKSDQVLAVNLIKQMATVNMSYSLDNNNDVNLLVATSVADSFWGRLTPYLYSDIAVDDPDMKDEIIRRLEGIFKTPDTTKMTKTFQQGVEIFEDAFELPVPFAFNSYLDPARNGGTAPKSTVFRDASQIFYFCYGAEWADETDAEEWKKLPKDSATRDIAIDWFPSKTAAFIFLDGHLELVSAPVPVRRFTENAGGTPPP